MVASDVSLNAKLYVANDASFAQHIGASDISAITFQTGRLVVEDNGANANSVRTTAGNLYLKPNSPTDWTVITSNLQVDGSINFTGSMIRTDTIVNVTEAFDVSNAGTRTALSVSHNAPSQSIASFDNGDATTPTFLVAAENKVAINKSSAFHNLDVSGTVGISQTLAVTGIVTFSDALNVTGDYSSTNGNVTLTNGNLTLTNGKITAKTLQVTEDATVDGNLTVTLACTLNKTGNALNITQGYINQVGNEAW
jgi:hypothetical protein